MPENTFGNMVNSAPLDKMFGAPLDAAIKAQVASAQATVDYVKRVGFDKAGNAIVVRSGYTQTIQEADSQRVVNRVIDMPLLALVPIPNLQIKSVKVDFELTVETSESEKSSQEYAGSAEGKVGWGPFSISFKASVACKSEQTRKTDTRARYSVEMMAEQAPPPEGMARLLDLLMNAAQPVDADKAPKIPAAQPN